MDAIDVKNDCYECRQVNGFVLLILKKRIQEIVTGEPDQSLLLQHLYLIQNSQDIKGLAIINAADYPGDAEYKSLLCKILPKTAYGDGYHSAFKYKTAIYNLLETIINFPVPIVGGLKGNVEPDTLGIFLAFDSRISSDKAIFSQPNIRLGFPPSAVLSFFLSRNLGPAKAIEHMLAKSEFSADEALDLGLLAQVLSENEIEEKCLEKLEELSLFPKHMVTETRRILQPDISEFYKHFDAFFESSRRVVY